VLIEITQRHQKANGKEQVFEIQGYRVM